jgi:hypothetical protein
LAGHYWFWPASTGFGRLAGHYWFWPAITGFGRFSAITGFGRPLPVLADFHFWP